MRIAPPMPLPLMRRDQSINSAARTKIFFASQPRNAHVPPYGRSSTIATRHDSFAHASATVAPEAPVPTTTRSNSFAASADTSGKLSERQGFAGMIGRVSPLLSLSWSGGKPSESYAAVTACLPGLAAEGAERRRCDESTVRIRRPFGTPLWMQRRRLFAVRSPRARPGGHQLAHYRRFAFQRRPSRVGAGGAHGGVGGQPLGHKCRRRAGIDAVDARHVGRLRYRQSVRSHREHYVRDGLLAVVAQS